MTFSMDNSLNEVLTLAGPMIRLFMPKELAALIPEAYRDVPMKEWADGFLMPWGLPFPAADFVQDANRVRNAQQYWDLVPLWDPEHFTVETNDLHSVALMVPKLTFEGVRPAVLICPGGGYENISFHSEGLETAARMAQRGWRPFILNYRFHPNRYPAPQTDLAFAIKYIRANAQAYRIDPQNLMILGYSAGGHLCASTTALRGEIDEALQKELERVRPELAGPYSRISMRPDQVCLCYPVISFLKEDHEPSFQALTGGNESLREHLSVEKQIDPDYPKTFVWTCADDSLVPPSNAERMDRALSEKQIPHLFRLYPQGEHGCSTGDGTSAAGWLDEMAAYMSI